MKKSRLFSLQLALEDSLRRTMIALRVAAVAPFVLAIIGCASDSNPRVGDWEFTATTITALDVDVSPDGSIVVFGALGDLYQVPVAGGAATAIRLGSSWDQRPKFSPSGNQIAFLSDGDSIDRGLWVSDRYGRHARLVSPEEIKILDFSWRSDGRAIIIANALGEIWEVSEDGSWSKLLVESLEFAPPVHSPELSSDQRTLYFDVGRHHRTIKKVERAHAGADFGSPTTVLANGFSPKLAPDERALVFARVESGKTHLILYNFATGQERTLMIGLEPADVEGNVMGRRHVIPEFAFSPDGGEIYVSQEGRLIRLSIADTAQTVIPLLVPLEKSVSVAPKSETSTYFDNRRVRNIRWVSVANSGQTISFSALGDVRIVNKEGKTKKTISSRDEAYYFPSLAKSGDRLAVVAQTPLHSSQVKVLGLRDDSDSTITDIHGQYFSPTFDHNGSRLAYVQRSMRNSDGKIIDTVRVFDFATGRTLDVVEIAGPLLRGLFHTYTKLAFDGRGNRVFYLEKSSQETYLKSARVDSGIVTTHMKMPREASTFDVSPNGQKVAYIDRTTLWVVSLDVNPNSATGVATTNKSETILVSDRGATDIAWVNDETLVWNFANRIHARKIDDLNSDSKLVAEISIRIREHKPYGRLAIEGANLVSMAEIGNVSNSLVVLDGNTVVDIQARPGHSNNEYSAILDATGLTMVPGYVDSHAHVHFYNRGLWPILNPGYLANIAYGVTTILDPQAPILDVLGQDEAVFSGRSIGPRVFSTGRAIIPWGEFPTTIDSFRDAMRLVRQLKERGAVMIKSYELPRRDQRRWILEASHQLGLSVTAEGQQSIGRDLSFVAEGHTAVEHMVPIVRFYSDAVALYAWSGVHLTPTIGVGNGRSFANDYFAGVERHTKDDKFLRFRNAGANPDFWGGVSGHMPTFVQAAENVARIIKAGGLVSIGSHAHPLSVNSLGVHWEMWLFDLGGVPKFEILRSATIRGAEKIGIDNYVGSIEPGKLADLLLLRCNPLENIRCTADIEYVVKNGFVWHADSMTQMWPEYKPLPKPWWHSDEDWEELKPELPEPWEGVPIADGVELNQPTIH